MTSTTTTTTTTTTANPSSATVTLTASGIVRLERLLAKNRRVARKLGLAPFTMTKTETSPRVLRTLYGEFVEPAWTVTLEGPTPIIEGYTLRAVVKRADGADRCYVFGDVDPQTYVHADLERCDCCNSRRLRNTLLVVADEDGIEKQVGSTCVRDYLGHDDPEALVFAATWLEDVRGMGSDDEEPSSIRISELAPSMETFLSQVAACIRAEGWQSRGKATDGTATVDVAQEVLRDIKKAEAAGAPDSVFGSSPKQWSPAFEVTARDRKEAVDAVAWLLSDDFEETSSYLVNLRTAGEQARAAGVTRTNAGLLASVFVAWKNVQRKESAKQLPAPKSGKYRVAGTLTDSWEKANHFNGGVDVKVALLTDEGYRFELTLTEKLAKLTGGKPEGKKVAVTATWKGYPGGRAYGSRPSKPTLERPRQGIGP